MINKENISDIEKLTKILSSIQNLYYKKKEELEELQLEISELKEVLNNLNSIISNKSFFSADEIYKETIIKGEESEANELFQETVPKEELQGTNIKRKIFSNDNQELVCVLNFYDLNNVEIKFINPEKNPIRETSEEFIGTFLKGALIKIKDDNPGMELKYSYVKDTDIIEKIEISNIRNVKDYDLITSQIRNLLSGENSSNY